jgi:hypothetical protein
MDATKFNFTLCIQGRSIDSPQGRLGGGSGGGCIEGVDIVLDRCGEDEEGHRPNEQCACAHQSLLQQVDHRLDLKNRISVVTEASKFMLVTVGRA